ncbi:MAG: copper resistance CopC family protein, partial [Gammaproteobacteria bacterium]
MTGAEEAVGAEHAEAHHVLLAVADSARFALTVVRAEESGVGCDVERAVLRIDTEPVHVCEAGTAISALALIAAPRDGDGHGSCGRDHEERRAEPSNQRPAPLGVFAGILVGASLLPSGFRVLASASHRFEPTTLHSRSAPVCGGARRWPMTLLRTTARRLLLTGLLAAVASVTVTAAPAFAHSAFVGSSPEPGTRLEQSPAKVTLSFTEPLTRK